MVRRRDEDEAPMLPFPLSDVSNGEWCPSPPTAKQRLTAKLLMEEADRRARRLGMSRRQFLRTAAGTATAFMVMNKVHGLDQTGDNAALAVTAEQCDDPEAGRTLFEADYFVMDVQLHHVDLERFNTTQLAFLRFRDRAPTDQETLQLLSQANMVKEVFVDSETAMGVLSGVPNGTPLPVDTMAATRNMVNDLAGSKRAVSQAMCDPRRSPGSQTSIDSLEHQVRELGAVALKCYTGSGSWWLDDEEVAYPMLDRASRLGLRLINVHKGFPQILGGNSMAADYVRSRDLPKVARDWPHLNFVAYHSGYFPERNTGPTTNIDEFLTVIRSMRRRRNVYAEIGSAFAAALSRGGNSAAHFIGALLRDLGPRRILWGTDSIWWGSPQWQIEGFKALTIPVSMQEQFGYPPLTHRAKAQILGLNAARLYRVRVDEKRCEIQNDQISRMREELGGIEASRTHLVYGPTTRRGFLKLLARDEQV